MMASWWCRTKTDFQHGYLLTDFQGTLRNTYGVNNMICNTVLMSLLLAGHMRHRRHHTETVLLKCNLSSEICDVVVILIVTDAISDDTLLSFISIFQQDQVVAAFILTYFSYCVFNACSLFIWMESEELHIIQH